MYRTAAVRKVRQVSDYVGVYVTGILLIALIAASGRLSFAQDPSSQPETTPDDTLRSYDLEEIVVTSGQERAISSSTLQRVRIAGIARQNAPAIDQAVRLIPAASVQTNSRGETLVYVRNAGERQVAVFFDGALLNVPWDNRVDLSLVPSSVIGGITVAKGVPSVVYGTNVLGGAVNLTTLTTDESHGEISAAVGLPHSVQTAATYLRDVRNLSVAFSIGYADDNGDAMPRKVDLPFSQPAGDVRTNTDRRMTNVFGKAAWKFASGDAVGVSVLHVDGEKGVAPESHIDPSQGRVRYWRYPLWENSMVILNGSARAGSFGRLRATAWGTRARQQIDAFQSVRYDDLQSRQENSDWVAGGRLVLSTDLWQSTITVAGNALTSVHVQRHIPVGGTQMRQIYQQHVYSLGAELEQWLSDRTRVDGGASIDGVSMPRSGERPERDPIMDYALRGGLIHRISDQINIRASAGRKVRFPTMREMFGEALQRFRVNPSLSPERSAAAEAGVSAASGSLSAELTAFLVRTFDTIDQTVLPDGRRMRINLDGSRVLGVETSLRGRPGNGWLLDGHATWMYTRGFQDGRSWPIAERPDVIGMLSVAYDAPFNASFLGQAVYSGTVYSMDEEGAFVSLPSSLQINTLVAYRLLLTKPRPIFGEIFARVDNLTDEVVLRQLGLPAAGREFKVGLTVLL